MSRLDRGLELVAASRAAGVELALLGGAAVAALCESARTGPYARELGDVDLAGSTARPSPDCRIRAVRGPQGRRVVQRGQQ